MNRTMSMVGKWYSLPLLFVIWQLCVSTGIVVSQLVPSLLKIADAFVHDMINGVLLHAAMITMGRALAGFMLALLVGVPLATVMVRSKWCSRLLEPTFFAGYPVPKIALFPVFTFIFGIGTPSKIAFTFLEALYPIVITTYVGMRGIQERWLWTGRNLGASPAQLLRRVIFPAALPSIFAGIRIALPVAITVVVVTEMIGDSSGLGYYVTIFSTRFQYQNVYAGLLMVGLCGFLLDRLLVWARHVCVYWERGRR
ncbi:ABC transporter permease [Paraburkholderia sp. BCC1885]|uniref:ABC transporter permease n=1 Tax=Paraburkholderia sp. BCC1885 TaxID=2562669 RepID=UPI001181F461|nr:ABC transporter permease [Paraburkholderia sp. BCC1885]